MEWIYAVELPQGRVKVGRTVHVQARLATHQRALGMTGVWLAQVWSCPVEDCVLAERRLIEQLLRTPGVTRTDLPEIFYGVSFLEVVSIASCIAAAVPNIQVVVDLPEDEAEEGEAEVPEELVPILRVFERHGVDRIPSRELASMLKMDPEALRHTLLRHGVRPRQLSHTQWGGSNRRGYRASDIRESLGLAPISPGVLLLPGAGS